MDPEFHHGHQAVRLAFLERLAADRAEGTFRSLEDYQALFPGYEAEIASEFAAVAGQTEHDEHDSTSAWLAGESSLEKIGPGQKFAHYEVDRELGRGGQGVVFLATDTRLRRRVALKVLYGLGLLSPSSLARFQREAELAGKLADPGICTIHDAGVVQGVPYIAMRYLEGETLARRMARWRDDPGDRPPIPEILELISSVADSLHVAHEHGVIHRDVKPGNIMVMQDHRPVVLDFGLARDLQGQAESLTGSATRLGTPAYMAPEQLALRKTEPDRRTDVFSLGVVLFEALTLEKPFQEVSLTGLRREVELPPPRNPRKLNAEVGRALRAVLDRALAADRRERYATALDLARDLDRIRQDAPVSARSVGPVRRFRRWMRRSPVVAGLTLGLFALLAAALAVFAVLYVQADEARRASEQARYYTIITAVPTLIEAGQLTEARRMLNSCPSDQTAWEHDYLHSQTELCCCAGRVGPAPILELWRPDDPEGADRVRNRWSVVTESGDTVSLERRGRTLAAGERRSIAPSASAASVSHGGRWLALVAREKDADRIRLCRARDGTCVDRLARPLDSVRRVAVTPDGQTVLFVEGPLATCHRVFCWDRITNTVKPVELSASGDVSVLALDRSGRQAVAAVWHRSRARQGVFLFDPRTGRITGRLEETERHVRAAAFSPDGRRLVTAAGGQAGRDDGVIRIWDLAAGRPLATMRHAFGEVTGLAVHPRDRWILAGTRSGAIHLLGGGLSRSAGTFPGLESAVTVVAFDARGQLAVAGDRAGSIRIWDVDRIRAEVPLDSDSGFIASLAFDARGDRLIAGVADRDLDVWDLNRLGRVDTRKVGFHTVVSWDPDDRHVWTWSQGAVQPVQRVEMKTGASETWIAAGDVDHAGTVALDLAHGRILYTEPDTHRIAVFSLASRAVVRRLTGAVALPNRIVVSRDGSRVAARVVRLEPIALRDAKPKLQTQVLVWDLGDPSAPPMWQSAVLASSLALGPKGRWLALSVKGGQLRLVDLGQHGYPIRTMEFPGGITALAFDPTGRRLAVCAEKRVSVVDPESGRVLLHLSEMPGVAQVASFSPDGDRLAVACGSGTLVLYETATAQRRVGSVPDDPEVARARAAVARACAARGSALEAALDLQERLVVSPARRQRLACRMAMVEAREEIRQQQRFCGALPEIVRWNCPPEWYCMIDAEQAHLPTQVGSSEVDHPGRLRRRGLILAGLGRWREAEEPLRKGVSPLDRPARKPASRTGRQVLARCVWHLGRRDEARKIDPGVEQRLKQARQPPPVRWLELFARRAAERSGRDPELYAQALGWIDQALTPHDRAVYRVTRGALLYRLGRPEAALIDLEAARARLAGTDHPCRATLTAFECLSHYALGHTNEAWSCYNEFVVSRNTARLSRRPHVLALEHELQRVLGVK